MPKPLHKADKLMGLINTVVFVCLLAFQSKLPYLTLSSGINVFYRRY